MVIKDHPYAIELDDHGEPLSDEAGEIARIWIDGHARVWIAAYRLEEAQEFGRLMADAVRRAAVAYSATLSLDEHETLQQIVDGFTQELREQIDDIITIEKGGLN
ncbi:DUF5076 domain-containing protein [Sphingomonas sp.]|uniref:DUF5076 domain-containing protein n=1 Tax=Sphingomonas sp. TaxID=28214 RepID=UPI0025ED8E5F|nr:DUF5076 domain-containing protein [Sphingomonas sp.]